MLSINQENAPTASLIMPSALSWIGGPNSGWAFAVKERCTDLKSRRRLPVVHERPRPMTFRNIFQQRQESTSTLITPSPPISFDAPSVPLESQSDNNHESPSMCFKDIEDSTETLCADSTSPRPVNTDEMVQLLQTYTPPASTGLCYNAGHNITSHVTYSYYSFLTFDMSGLEPDDIHYLESRGCLGVPTPDVLDDFIREYFLHVHPGLPLLDEAKFWAIYSDNKEPCDESTVSLFVFQAMLFTSCSVSH
jgi:hypothetical protein